MNKAIFNTNLKLDYSGEEAINTVCSNLTFSGNNIKKVVITSCEPNDGKSFISMQTAINMGNRGKRVLLIDADMRMSVFNAHHVVQFKGSRYGLAHLLSVDGHLVADGSGLDDVERVAVAGGIAVVGSVVAHERLHVILRLVNLESVNSHWRKGITRPSSDTERYA